MYVMFLGMGHTLLCKTVESETIKHYITTAATQVQNYFKVHHTHDHLHPNPPLPWFYPICTRAYGATWIVQEILDCLKEIHQWENMKDHREPLTMDMIHYL